MHFLRSNAKTEHITEDYRKILDSIKGLKEQIRWTLEYCPGAINDVASMVSHIPTRFQCPCSLPSKVDCASTKGRTNDCGSLHNNGLKYIPCIAGIPKLEPHVKKERWGFLHHLTACLLCPCHLWDYFNNNRERFCHQILEASLVITHNNWPLFLFPNNLYNLSHIDKYLL